MTLSREAILGASDVQRETVETPEWGGSVIVQAMTAADYEGWVATWARVDGEKVIEDRTFYRQKLVVRCVVDDSGTRVFTDADAEALAGKSAAAFNRVFLVAQRLNGFSDQDLKAAEKN